MPDELKPCPHCGGTDIGLADNTGPKLCTAPHAYAWCRNKDCHASGNESDTVAEAIAAWNQRTSPPAADLTEVRAALTHAKNTFYHYAKLHRAKRTEDGDEKACTNAGMGEEMAQALAVLALFHAHQDHPNANPSSPDTAALVEELGDALAECHNDLVIQGRKTRNPTMDELAQAILPIIARERDQAQLDGAKVMQVEVVVMLENEGNNLLRSTNPVDRAIGLALTCRVDNLRDFDPARLCKDWTP